MNKWNADVDAYISESSDKRSTFDIELEAKIGWHGGPHYKRCEAKGCVNTEGREIEKMKRCSGCKRVRDVVSQALNQYLSTSQIMYCSQECQTKDWKKHKKVCASKTHPIQQLRSQQTLDRLMAMQKSAIGECIAAGINFKRFIDGLCPV